MKRIIIIMRTGFLFLTIITFIITPNLLISQSTSGNLIENPSFEDGIDSYPGQHNPNLDGLNNWLNFGTSDRWSTFDFPEMHNLPNARTGERSIGFGPCEGAQIKLKSPNLNYPNFIPYSYITTEFFYRTSFDVETEINYYHLFSSSDIESCYSDESFNQGLSKSVTVLNGSNLQWNKHVQDIGEPVFLTKENAFNWFAIKGEHDVGYFSSNKYIFIEDVKVQFTPYCDHPCAGNKVDPVYAHFYDADNEVEVYTENFEEAVRNWTNNMEIGLINLANANFVKLTICNRWGTCDEWEWFYPNGLSNSGYNSADFESNNLSQFVQNRPDLFTVTWNGRLNGVRYPSTNVYTAKLEVANCGVALAQPFFFNITQFGNDEHEEVLHTPTMTLSPNCCSVTPPSIIYTIEVLSNHDRYKESITMQDNFIWVESNTYLGESGNWLELKPNSDITPAGSGNFTLKINPLCSNEPSQMKQDNIQFKVLNSLDKNSLDLKIYPNPFIDKLFINDADNDVNRIRIVDVSGQVKMNKILTLQANVSTHKVDVSSLDKGIYIIEIYYKNGYVSRKKTIKK